MYHFWVLVLTVTQNIVVHHYPYILNVIRKGSCSNSSCFNNITLSLKTWVRKEVVDIVKSLFRHSPVMTHSHASEFFYHVPGKTNMQGLTDQLIHAVRKQDSNWIWVYIRTYTTLPITIMRFGKRGGEKKSSNYLQHHNSWTHSHSQQSLSIKIMLYLRCKLQR